MDALRPPDEPFAGLHGYDFEPHYAEVGGLRLHYVDEGSGDPVVCFHGEPSWAYLYRKMVPSLVAGSLRVVCPDYAGFGRSDKPVDREWYSYDGHVQLMTELLAGLGVRDATDVVQVWGRPRSVRRSVVEQTRVARLGAPD